MKIAFIVCVLFLAILTIFLVINIAKRLLGKEVPNTSGRTIFDKEIPSSDRRLLNPLMGFAPSADNLDGEHDDATLVFVGVTWRELELAQGVFDFDGVKERNHLNHWRAEGKKVVFRFFCDYPGDQDNVDIPEWLYELTGDGDHYNTSYGTGYSPNYENELFIACHKEAIEALGREFGQDDFFAFVEIGSLGHWGEWHVNTLNGVRPLPNENIRKLYVDPYIASFPNAYSMMRRPFNQVKSNKLGIFNDVIGEQSSTELWLQWIKEGGGYSETGEKQAMTAVPDQWKIAPIGGEFTSSLSMEYMLGDNLQNTVDMIKRSHTSFIGPKIPLSEDAGTPIEGVDAVKMSLGYRLRVKHANLSRITAASSFLLTLSWVNDGIAPFYRDWPIKLYFFDSDDNCLAIVPVYLASSKLIDADEVESITIFSMELLPDGIYRIGVGITDPASGQPAVQLAMNDEIEENVYFIGKFSSD